MTSAIIFDIEGTIGDIAFVRTVLFPYARDRLVPFLTAEWKNPAIVSIVAETGTIAGSALPTPEQAAAVFASWIDQDKKITPLKALQGHIWRAGYESGELKAHLYDDAVRFMRKQHKNGVRLFIYSSGSIDAQKLYLKYSVAGDLTDLLEGYFDTTTGPKADATSYAAIAKAIDLKTESITFFSDAHAEVIAAKAVGMNVFCVDRSTQTAVASAPPGIRTITNFGELGLD